MPDFAGFLQVLSALAVLVSECLSVFCEREPEQVPEPEPERKGAIAVPASLGCV